MTARRATSPPSANTTSRRPPGAPARRRGRPVGRPPRSAISGETADRREEIVEAAARVLGTKGYAATSLKDIAVAAGVTPALIYHYFDSKEDLLLATMASVQSTLHRAVDAAGAGVSDPFERIAATVDEAAAQVAAHPEFFRLIADMWGLGLSQPSIRQKALQMLEIGIGRQAEQVRAYYAELGAEAPPLPAEDLAGAIVAAIDGIALSAIVRAVDPAGMYRGLKLLLLLGAAFPYAAAGQAPSLERLLALVGAPNETEEPG
jgi:TetR/AcrR family transcriptional repressor of bet genes